MNKGEKMKKYKIIVKQPIVTGILVSLAFVTVILSIFGIIYLIDQTEIHEIAG